LSDNGGEFVSELLKAFHLNLGVKESHGLPYHPQTQGVDERSHATIKAKFRSNVQQLRIDPNKLTLGAARQMLQDVLNTYNHERHTTTQCIPYELFWKRTDRNFNVPISSLPVDEKVFSELEYAHMQEKATSSMVKKAGQSVARLVPI
jgi:hypothetical protein